MLRNRVLRMENDTTTISVYEVLIRICHLTTGVAYSNHTILFEYSSCVRKYIFEIKVGFRGRSTTALLLYTVPGIAPL